jgi:hypothetical protein
MKHYPIWIDVNACIYKSSKSYGAKDTNEQTIYVGTSRSNSHELVRIVTTKREKGNYIVFKFSVDDNVIKTKYMDKKTKEIVANHIAEENIKNEERANVE